MSVTDPTAFAGQDARQFRSYVYTELKRQGRDKEWLADALGIKTSSLYVMIGRNPVSEKFKRRVIEALHAGEHFSTYLGRPLFVGEGDTETDRARAWMASWIRDVGAARLAELASEALNEELRSRGREPLHGVRAKVDYISVQ